MRHTHEEAITRGGAEKNPRFAVDSWVLWGEAARRKSEITSIQNVVKPYAMAANTEN
jgi:hypothetical protein